MTHANALLIKFQALQPGNLTSLGLRVHQACHLQGLSAWHAVRIASTPDAENGLPMTHVYLECADGDAAEVTNAQRENLTDALSHQVQGVVQVSRLRSVMRLRSSEPQTVACCHYVVETDIDDAWRAEVYRWYDEEHLPGLARVAGCVRAQRWLNWDHGPVSLACYDMTAAEVLLSEAWRKVRGTDWSSRCRPHFQNTLRTFFEHVQWPTQDL